MQNDFDNKATRLKKRWREFRENNILMNFTVVLVPHRSDKKPIRFNIPVGVILGSFAALLLLLCGTLFFTYNTFHLQKVAVENARLNKISEQQEQQLSDEIIGALDSLNESEDEVRSKVGLEDAALGVGGLPAETENDDEAGWTSLYGDGELSARLLTLSDKLDAIDSYTGYQFSRMQLLEADVADRLDYLNSLPVGYPVDEPVVTSGYGLRLNPFNHRRVEMHAGIDYAHEYGTPIYASGAGTVTSACYESGYGNIVRIDHGYGYMSIYAHCSELKVTAGQHVERKDVVALMGSSGRSTGTHVHFGVSYNQSWIDPEQLLGADVSKL